MIVIQKDTYAEAKAITDRIGAFVTLCQSSGPTWGPVYAAACGSNGVVSDPPTNFGVEWKDWMDVAVWTVAATAENNVQGVVASIGDPLLIMDSGESPNDISRVDAALYAFSRGQWNGGTWVELPPVWPPEEEEEP